MTTKVNIRVESKVKSINAHAKDAKVALKKRGLMYYINELNRLARKNEYIDNTSLLALGKDVREYCTSVGIDVRPNQWFDARVFTLVEGKSCYKHTKHVKESGYFAQTEDIITWKEVRLSENGLINAYRYILAQWGKQLDKDAREARKALNVEKTKARKALKKEQDKAIIAWRKGEICAEEFAEIMAKAV